ncbi:MAG: DinB family protein, partial [Flavobacteriaceae bacterium]|nr:DinB family protein [Flavobacteriaceae bacterium]
MEKQVEILKANRKGILSLIEGLSIMQLNKIPQGFKNNIAWNVAHLLVTQQLLCYKLS